MRIETPQSPIEQPAKLQSIEDIQFELVVEGDPDFETAVSVINENGEQPEDKLRDAAKREVVRINWWLQEQWASKGLPKEQVSIKVANLAIEIYNYGQELSTSQIEEAKRVIAMLSQASIPEQDSRIKYVAINDTDEMNDQNGENKRGYAFPASKIIHRLRIRRGLFFVFSWVFLLYSVAYPCENWLLEILSFQFLQLA